MAQSSSWDGAHPKNLHCSTSWSSSWVGARNVARPQQRRGPRQRGLQELGLAFACGPGPPSPNGRGQTASMTSRATRRRQTSTSPRSTDRCSSHSSTVTQGTAEFRENFSIDTRGSGATKNSNMLVADKLAAALLLLAFNILPPTALSVDAAPSRRFKDERFGFFTWQSLATWPGGVAIPTRRVFGLPRYLPCRLCLWVSRLPSCTSSLDSSVLCCCRSGGFSYVHRRCSPCLPLPLFPDLALWKAAIWLKKRSMGCVVFTAACARLSWSITAIKNSTEVSRQLLSTMCSCNGPSGNILSASRPSVCSWETSLDSISAVDGSIELSTSVR